MGEADLGVAGEERGGEAGLPEHGVGAAHLLVEGGQVEVGGGVAGVGLDGPAIGAQGSAELAVGGVGGGEVVEERGARAAPAGAPEVGDGLVLAALAVGEEAELVVAFAEGGVARDGEAEQAAGLVAAAGVERGAGLVEMAACRALRLGANAGRAAGEAQACENTRRETKGTGTCG